MGNFRFMNMNMFNDISKKQPEMYRRVLAFSYNFQKIYLCQYAKSTNNNDDENTYVWRGGDISSVYSTFTKEYPLELSPYWIYFEDCRDILIGKKNDIDQEQNNDIENRAEILDLRS